MSGPVNFLLARSYARAKRQLAAIPVGLGPLVLRHILSNALPLMYYDAHRAYFPIY